jgi:3-carboxy-cis,cis-muconate cycloisomerase
VSLALGADLAAGLRVDDARMRANVDTQHGYVLAEPVMLALGAEIGPRRAHELVHAAAARGIAEGQTLNHALAADPEIARHLTTERIEELLRPESALGSARELVDRVLGS